MKYSDKDEFGRPFNIPQMYKVPYIKIEDNERPEPRHPGAMSSLNTVTTLGGRSNRTLFIVSFKCSRVDVFFLLNNTGLEIKEGDIVIVEADRGQDLGEYHVLICHPSVSIADFYSQVLFNTPTSLKQKLGSTKRNITKNSTNGS